MQDRVSATIVIINAIALLWIFAVHADLAIKIWVLANLGALQWANHWQYIGWLLFGVICTAVGDSKIQAVVISQLLFVCAILCCWQLFWLRFQCDDCEISLRGQCGRCALLN